MASVLRRLGAGRPKSNVIQVIAGSGQEQSSYVDACTNPARPLFELASGFGTEAKILKE